MEKAKIAILGLGIMGTGMAHRLLSSGFPLVVYNRNPEKSGPLADKGASVSASPRDAASSSRVILSMVANDEASRDVWLGNDGALAGASEGSLLIECSTLTSAWILELDSEARKRGCRFLDAPVTGTKPHAANG